ncbi:MAG: YciI family protein [Alphaproteobacteria bacterium]|nr:YciI family protein [Alphaproteobacteria bacterium]MDE2111086.1 YciI family protein [Alphaproteobacteria bacterium]MDE2494786.1 YciI family protein [Alphaproteobacteria bacterium]
MLFVVIAIDKESALPLRMATREAHLAYLRETPGMLRLGGPFLDARGDMNGSLMIVEADNLEAAKSWHANDPYVKAGVFASSEVKPWKVTANPVEAKF